MWERYLQGDLLTSDLMLAFGCLVTFDVDRGIDDNWWGPAPAQAAADDEAPARPDPKLFEQQLKDADVDHDDLLALLEEPITKPEAASPLRRRSARHR